MNHTETKEQFLSAMHHFASLRSLPCFETGGLTRGEFFCLTMIRRMCRDRSEGQGVYIWELAEQMRVRPPAVSRMLRGLGERDLIVRTVDRRDRRSTCVALTKEGQTVWAETHRQLSSFTDRVIARMGTEDMSALTGHLERLCAIIEEERSREAESC